MPCNTERCTPVYMNKEFWDKTYAKSIVPTDPSSFATWCLPSITGDLVDLGCGNGRDLYFFKSKGIRAHGVDASNEDLFIVKQDVGTYMKQNPSPQNVYTRFFWHAIERDLQLEILDWATGRIFIEARTTKDKPQNVIGKHKRHPVDENRLKRDLTERGYTIIQWVSGIDMAPYKDENPHLVRVIADRS